MTHDRTHLRALSRVRSTYRFWGRHPALYGAQDWLTFLGRPGVVRRRAVAALGLRPGDRVLEVGCGTGRNLPYLVSAVGRSGAVVGVDASREMLAAAARLATGAGWDNVRLVEGDAAVLDVRDGPFDGVLAVLALSAMPRWEDALRRCREVLRPGGRLVVCDARPFPGRLRVLNPVVRALYRRGAAWRPDRDVVAGVRRTFGHVVVEPLNAGSFFIATARSGRDATVGDHGEANTGEEQTDG